MLTSQITYLRIWNLAWPIILANITIPLIGATNIAVVGRLPDPKYMGGVALGMVVLQCIYWSFAFLRKSTTAVTAQALGSGNQQEVCIALLRGLYIAMLLGLLIYILQFPVSYIAFKILQASPEVESLAKTYFDIRIIGVFATFGNYVVLGWLYGVQRTRLAMILRVIVNLINIPLAIFFVTSLGFDVDGVAYSALISNVIIFFVSLLILFMGLKDILGYSSHAQSWSFIVENCSVVTSQSKLKKLLLINWDIFIRTLFLYFAFSWFTAKGAEQGDLILAVNTVLLNMFWFISYALDGFANAAETLAGQALGANKVSMFDEAVTRTTKMAGLFAIIFALVYWLAGDSVVSLLTNIEEVRSTCGHYLLWLVAFPITAIWAFQLDGIYIGVTQTKIMRNMMIVSFVLYAVAILLLPRFWDNHGLWMSLHVFMLVRAMSLLLPYRQMRDNCFT